MKLKDVDVITEKDLSVEAAGPSKAGKKREADAGAQGVDADQPAAEDGREGLWPVERLRPVLEAVLFAAGDPLSIKRMSEVIDGPTRKEVYDGLKAIKNDFLTNGLRLVEVAGGWQFRTAPEHHAVVKRLFKERPQRLSRAAVETAAIVAYRQPCTRQDVESIRGVDCGGVLETLVERTLLKIAGRREVPGRPLVYATTTEFLELFGLKDLKSLPALAELDDDIRALAEDTDFAERGEATGVVALEDEEIGEANDEEPPTVRVFDGTQSVEEADNDAQDETGHAENDEYQNEAAGADEKDGL